MTKLKGIGKKHNTFDRNSSMRKSFVRKGPTRAETMRVTKNRTRFANVTGIILCRGKRSGTAFAVKDNYVMTAKYNLLALFGLVQEHDEGKDITGKIKQELKENKGNAGVCFNYEDEIPSKPNIVQFDPSKVYIYDRCGIVVLKLATSLKRSPEIKFGSLSQDRNFFLIGHPNNEQKQTEPDGKLVQREDIHSFQSQLKEKYPNLYKSDVNPYSGTESCKEVDLISCSFSGNNHGMPGIFVDDIGRVFVCAMLNGSFPHITPDLADEDKKSFDKRYRVHTAVKIVSIYKEMKDKNPTLCSDIFNSSHSFA